MSDVKEVFSLYKELKQVFSEGQTEKSRLLKELEALKQDLIEHRPGQERSDRMDAIYSEFDAKRAELQSELTAKVEENRILWDKYCKEVAMKRTQEQYFAQMARMREQAERDARIAHDLAPRTCAICLCEYDVDDLAVLEECRCEHHRPCIKQYVESSIDSRNLPLKCPNPECAAEIQVSDLKLLFPDAELEKFYERTLAMSLAADEHTVYCQKPNCGFALFDQRDETQTMMKCLKCGSSWCKKCKIAYHFDMTCEQYNQWKKDNDNADDLFEVWKRKNTKACPRCHAAIQKTTGCNKMSCPQCKSSFCWICLTIGGYEHFRNSKKCKLHS